MEQCVFISDLTIVIQLIKYLVKGLHAQFGGFFHQLFQVRYFTLTNHVLRQRRIDQDFETGATALTIRCRNQLLCNDGFQVERQVHPQLTVAIRREEVNDTVQRLAGVVGVQGTETQVTSFCEGDSVVHGFPGAHLTDQDYIRGLTQGVLQGHLKRFCINAHFALGDDAAFVLVDKLDRVFDRDNVTFAVAVAVTDHGSQRSRLTGTGSTHEDNQAAFGHGQLFDDLRQAQVVNAWNVGFNAAQHHAGQVALIKRAGTEATDAPRADGKVEFFIVQKFTALFFIHHAQHKFANFLRREGRGGNGNDLAVQFDGRWNAGSDK